METFVLGAAHSGKSEWALTQLNLDAPTTVIGTAVLSGLEDRINSLKNARPKHWKHLESGDLFDQLKLAFAAAPDQIVIDSLNQWLANYLLDSWLKYDRKQHEARITLELERLFHIIDAHPSTHVLSVSSEVGAGITPPDELSRFFRQTLGHVNQRFAARANTVVQIVAGLPIFMTKVR
ncbi:MAG: bifunctional adenosylcobinamide kinase/adenosylcobinamide-phosphate guanylyltransferase [Bdellovibrionota bacterium]